MREASACSTESCGVEASIYLAVYRAIDAFRWWDLRLYWLPVLLLFAPLASGVRPIAANGLVLSLVGYAATGLFEEVMWRGVILGELRPTGLWRAVLLSSRYLALRISEIRCCAVCRH